MSTSKNNSPSQAYLVKTLETKLCSFQNMTETKIALAHSPKATTLRSCSVCGEDSWCGSDGCPLDPQ